MSGDQISEVLGRLDREVRDIVRAGVEAEFKRLFSGLASRVEAVERSVDTLTKPPPSSSPVHPRTGQVWGWADGDDGEFLLLYPVTTTVNGSWVVFIKDMTDAYGSVELSRFFGAVVRPPAPVDDKRQDEDILAKRYIREATLDELLFALAFVAKKVPLKGVS